MPRPPATWLVVGTAFFALSALLVGTMWVVPYLPTNDGPEWVFATHVENHYGDPDTPYRDEYLPAPQFASLAFTLLYGPLESWLGWQHGLQVALSVVVVSVAWSFAILIASIDRRRWPLAFLGFPLALSWSLYMGFWAFALASAGGLLTLAVAVRLRGGVGLLEGAGLSAMLLVVAVGHIFAAVLASGVLLTLFIARAPTGGRRLAAMATAMAISAPAAAIGLASVVVAKHDATKVAFAERLGWLSFGDVLALLPQTLAPGSLWRALLVALAVAIVGVAAGLRAFRTGTSAEDCGLGVAAVALLLLSALAPIQVPGWQFLAQRFVPLGVGLAIAVVPFERLESASRRTATWLLLAVSLGYVALSYPFHRRLALLTRDAVDGLAAPIRRTGEVLPLALAVTEVPEHDFFHAEVPMLDPLLHMGALYAAVQGGLTPYTWATSIATHPFTLRSKGSSRPVPRVEEYGPVIRSKEFETSSDFRRQIDDELASFSMFYDGVVLLAARPEDREVWRARGFVLDWERGGTVLAHFEPCAIELTTPATAAEQRATVDVTVGLFAPVSGAHPTSSLSDGLARFVVPAAPCGEVLVRVTWSPTAVDRPSRCVNADAAGWMRAHITREKRVVSCDELVEVGSNASR